ncbi:MAG: DUF975 family protein [Planctomycetota bacterium]
MKQWHCYLRGEQLGPFTEDEIRRMVAEGRLGPQDLVWTEGMAEWAAAAVALPDAFPEAAMPVVAYAASNPLGLPSNRRGTGGQTPNVEITARARQALSGRWGLPIGFCFLLWLLTTGIGFFPYLGGLANLILSGPFQLGAAIFFLTFTRTGEGELGMMFRGFRLFGSALGLYLLTGIFILLWMLPGLLATAVLAFLVGTTPSSGPVAAFMVFLFIVCILSAIIPGIVAAYAYSQAMYILADNPSIGCTEPLRRSKAMMRGNKGKLFCLGLRFIGWGLLCLLTLGIGYLWLMPYMSTSFAIFHNDLHQAAATGAEPAAERIA